jgi:hypothetical protein
MVFFLLREVVFDLSASQFFQRGTNGVVVGVMIGVGGMGPPPPLTKGLPGEPVMNG